MSVAWVDAGVTVTVEMAMGLGAIPEEDVALVLEIETETASTSSAAIGEASIETSWTGLGWFTIEDDPDGKIETGGLIADETVGAGTWVDVSAFVESWTVRHIKPSRFAGFDARTLSLTLHDDANRNFDPLNVLGEYVAGTTSLLREGLRVRVKATYTSATYGPVEHWLFTGFVSSWPVSLDTWPAGQVTVECHDWFGILARGEAAAVAAVGANETVDARIGRILDAAGVPLVERDISTTTTTCASTTLADGHLTMLKAASASDGGNVWVAADGRITFQSWASYWTSDQFNRVQWTLTNDPTGAIYECDYEDAPVVSNDMRDTVSRVILARAGGTEQDANDSGLYTLYGNRVFQRSDLVNANDTDVLALAAAMVATQPTLPVRISQVTIRPDIHLAAVDAALGIALWDRVAVVHDQVSGGTITRHAVVVGIEHRAQDVGWSTSFTLQDVTDLQVFTIEESSIEGDDMII